MKRDEAKKVALSTLMDYVDDKDENGFAPLISDMLEHVIEDWNDLFLLQMVCQESFE